MTLTELLQSRYTVRGFKPEPVDDDTLREVLSLASLAPSNCNIQPWHLAIASGHTKDRLREAMLAEVASGKQPSPYYQPGDANLTGAYKDRQYDCAFRYYDTMGIERKERDKRQALMRKNWEFFDAPHVGFLSMPKTMGACNAVDIGIFFQSLMLLFAERGIGCCPQGALAYYPEPAYAMLDIPEENAIICGVSFGYEDCKATINQVRMPREPLENFVSFSN